MSTHKWWECAIIHSGKFLRWKRKTHAVVIHWMWVMGVMLRCFVCWLNIVCHSLSGIRGREVLRHDMEQWGRSLESRWAGSDRVWGIEPFKKEGRAEDRLENKLWTENDRGVMLLICSLLHDILFQARHEEVLELHFNNWLLSFSNDIFIKWKVVYFTDTFHSVAAFHSSWIEQWTGWKRVAVSAEIAHYWNILSAQNTSVPQK